MPAPLDAGVELEITKVVGSLLTVTPLSVALTKIVTVPAASPAVNVTDDSVEEDRLPRALVTDQE
jgi:hypothetical protein